MRHGGVVVETCRRTSLAEYKVVAYLFGYVAPKGLANCEVGIARYLYSPRPVDGVPGNRVGRFILMMSSMKTMCVSPSPLSGSVTNLGTPLVGSLTSE